MFSYGMELYFEFYIREREQELRGMRAYAVPREPGDRLGLVGTVFHYVGVAAYGVVTGIRRVPHGRAS
jgi:hypothetical protein